MGENKLATINGGKIGTEVVDADLMIQEFFIFDGKEDVFTFEEGFFDELRKRIMRNLSGKSVYIQDVYFSTSPLLKNEIGKPRSFRKPGILKKLLKDDNKIESSFFKDLFSTNNIHTYRVLCTADTNYYDSTFKDIITGINIPCCCAKIDRKRIHFVLEHGEILNIGAPTPILSTDSFLTKTNFFTFDPFHSVIDVWSGKYYYFDNFAKIPVGCELLGKCKARLENVFFSEEVRKYVDKICNKEAYTRHLLSIFSLIDTAEFNDFYSVNPFIPAELIEFYKQYLVYKERVQGRPYLGLEHAGSPSVISANEEISIANCFKLVTDIKQAISQKHSIEQAELYNELDTIISKHKSVSANSEPELIKCFMKDLQIFYSQLSSSKVETANKKVVDASVFEDYFNYFYNDVSNKKLDNEMQNTIIDEFFTYMIYFVENAYEFDFAISLRLKSLIIMSLTNMLLLNEKIRRNIFEKIPPVYLKDIRIELGRILDRCVQIIDKNNPCRFSLYSLSFEELDDIDFINKGLMLSGKLDKEVLSETIEKEIVDKKSGR